MNLGMMTVGATMADGRTVLLCGMIWTEATQAVPIKPRNFFYKPTFQLCQAKQLASMIVLLMTLRKIWILHSGSWWLSGFNLFIPECDLWYLFLLCFPEEMRVVRIQFQGCFEWTIDFVI